MNADKTLMKQELMRAIQREEDQKAIAAGIADMEAGRVVPFEEVDARIRSRLGLPPRQS